MGRPKGSKNKPKGMVAELAAADQIVFTEEEQAQLTKLNATVGRQGSHWNVSSAALKAWEKLADKYAAYLRSQGK